MEWYGKRVLVTGGTSGVGGELVRVLVDRGAAVATCGRDPAALAACAALPTPGGKGRRGSVGAWRADLSVVGETTRVVRLAADHLGGLDVVIANAGVQHPADLTGGPDEKLLARAGEEIAVNLHAVVELAVASWPYLAAQPSAAFVALTSALAYAPKTSAPVYCATKAGLHVLLESLRHQARARTPGVRVTEVVLPLVDTRMTAGREGPGGKMTPYQAAEAIASGVRAERDVLAVGAARALLALLRIWPAAGRRILRDG